MEYNGAAPRFYCKYLFQNIISVLSHVYKSKYLLAGGSSKQLHAEIIDSTQSQEMK